MIWSDNAPAYQDRLGTNRANGARFMPFGDEITSTSNDREKFATYTRDSYTGLDYANQRYFASVYGRFNTPDLTGKGMGLSEPESFNRYSYVLGDPVNLNDPRGKCGVDVADGTVDYNDCLFDPDSYGNLPDIGGIDFDTMIEAQIANAIAGAQQAGQRNLSTELATGLTSALNALNDPKCAQLFGVGSSTNGPVTPGEVLLDIYMGIGNYGTIGFGDIASPPGTVVSATTTPVVAIPQQGGPAYSEADILINDLAGTFVTGNSRSQMITILHELGHAMNDIFGAGTSKIVDDGTGVTNGISKSEHNTALIRKDCK